MKKQRKDRKENCLAISKKLLFPPVWVMMIPAVVSVTAMVAVLVKGRDTSPIAYVIYVLAFYTLTVICVACGFNFPRYYKTIKLKIYNNKYGNRWM